MRTTTILRPFDDDQYQHMKQKHKENILRIKEVLNDDYFPQNLAFQNYLNKISISEIDYLEAIKSTLITTKVFIKRSFSDRYTNDHNPGILLG